MLDTGNELFAVAAEIAEFVERGVDAWADDAAVVEGERRLVHDGLLDAGAEVFERIEELLELVEARSGESGESCLRGGNLGERGCECQCVAGIRGLESDAGEESFDVEDAVESATKFFAGDEVADAGFDGVEAEFDLGEVD